MKKNMKKRPKGWQPTMPTITEKDLSPLPKELSTRGCWAMTQAILNQTFVDAKNFDKAREVREWASMRPNLTLELWAEIAGYDAERVRKNLIMKCNKTLTYA